MTVPLLVEDDLSALVDAFPRLDFTDPECRAVLLENQSIDVQAAPGSGKTTILAARLYLLSRKWASDRQGICVISHTNTASHEIRHRLAETAEGHRLLSYPHFIGTIHAFVNQYLALPSLRSAGGIVDVIDDDVFERRALSEARRNNTIAYWMKKNPNSAPDIVAGLRYSGDDLTLTSAGGNLPGPGKVLRALDSLKHKLSIAGVFRYEDMFAFAQNALASRPRTKTLISRRFPLVMIEEMQDTSSEQAALSRRTFNDNVIVQRFGDVNQRILNNSDIGDVTFAEAGGLPMSTSRRFGPVIADIVSKVRHDGPPIVGAGPSAVVQPTLLVYETDKVEQVITHFGRLVLEAFDDATLTSGGHIRAIGARRSGDAGQAPGRHVGDYWPPFASQTKTSTQKTSNAWVMLGADAIMGSAPVDLGERAERVRHIMLLALRDAKAPVAANVREPWRLFRALREAEYDVSDMQMACRHIVLDKTAGQGNKSKQKVIARLYSALAPLMPGTTPDEFASLPVFEAPDDDEDALPIGHPHGVHVEVNGRTVIVSVDTVAMAKGETHLATLYLECLGHPSRRFDVTEALRRITGRPAEKKPPGSLPNLLRHVYVGVSRPTRFLCLSINRSRLVAGDLDALASSGWRVLDVL